MPEIDLTENKIPPGQQLVAGDKWPIIGEREPAHSTEAWNLSFSGMIENPLTLTLEQLVEMPQTTLRMDIHCVTRWTRQCVAFTGVLLADLLTPLKLQPSAQFLSFGSRSNRKDSSSLPIDTALAQQTLIALAVDGQPLPPSHGGPIRNIVPGRYFYKSVKWLESIEVLEHDRLGFWEAETGYHNNADYWLEQRYMSPTIDRRTAIKLIESRDFSGRDLRSIDASKRELGGLKAIDSLLRDADFRNSNLSNADFSGANLSNAHFENCNLQNARFVKTDLEGANLSGADLRGAHFEDCSLIGASFTQTGADGQTLSAQIDQSTSMDLRMLEPLTTEQFKFVQACLKQ